MFNTNRATKDGFNTICKACVAITRKKYKNSEHGKNVEKRYRASSKDRRSEYYKKYNKTEKRKNWIREYNKYSKMKKNYDLSKETYDKMITEQENKCYICKIQLNRANIDHCHKTGKVRAILCTGCNHGLGNFKENTDLLKKAILYIQYFGEKNEEL